MNLSNLLLPRTRITYTKTHIAIDDLCVLYLMQVKLNLSAICSVLSLLMEICESSSFAGG